MAKRRTQPKTVHSQPVGPRPCTWTYKDSIFWKRASAAGDTCMSLSIENVVKNSIALSTQTPCHVPLFTRHDQVHLDNVLYLMEQFVTEEGLTQLGPVGCALCIIVAYVHDLGMLPDPEWATRLREHNSDDYVRLRSWATRHHPDLLDLLDICRRVSHPTVDSSDWRSRTEWIDNFIQADYLRQTHTDNQTTNRIESHLRRIMQHGALKTPFEFLGTDDLAINLISLLAASHGYSVDWLNRQLWTKYQVSNEQPFHAKLGDINIHLPAILLRLADICDFDFARTPAILFQHLGLEGFSALGLEDPAVNLSSLTPEQAKSNTRSVIEWMKHMAIDRWSLTSSNELVYVACNCRHPVVHRAILQFRDTIEQEMTAVSSEMRSNYPRGSENWLRLPVVKADITPTGYVYHDVSFHLKAREVMKLLMGTALYGNPELCIRELLQNALDAVQLRDLRWQLISRLHSRGIALPYWFNGGEEWTQAEQDSPKIVMDWGWDQAAQRNWLRVRDAGTGMTLSQIQNYLSALGHSYYKSEDFEAERRLLQENGLIVTPISQFGIGILSCFMIADWIEIRTCPCDRNENDRSPWQIRITGPGTLFHFSKVSLDAGIRPGTEVKLFLKEEIKITELRGEQLLNALRYALGYGYNYTDDKPSTTADVVGFNPTVVAATHVLWPRYPIVTGEEGSETIVIDNHLHFDILSTIDEHRLRTNARRWQCPAKMLQNVRWHYYDWTDDVTGTRLRLVMPNCAPIGSLSGPEVLRDQVNRARVWELAVLTSGSVKCSEHTRYLVKGMYVKDLSLVSPSIEYACAGVGARLWVDLAGTATPLLSADRTTAVLPDKYLKAKWEDDVQQVFLRWIKYLNDNLGPAAFSESINLRMVLTLRSGLSDRLSRVPRGQTAWSLRMCNVPSWKCSANIAASWVSSAIANEGNCGHGGYCHGRDPHMSQDCSFDGHRDVFERRPRFDETILDHAKNHGFPVTMNTLRCLKTFAAASKVVTALGSTLTAHVDATLLNEGFWPSFNDSFPPFKLPADGVTLHNALHVSPTEVLWICGEDPQRLVHGYNDTQLDKYGYDLVLPLFAIARPCLRKRFPEWEYTRMWSLFATLPFLFSDGRLAKLVSKSLVRPKLDKESTDEEMIQQKQIHVVARQLGRDTIHALLPRVELWDKPFFKWTTKDWLWCGYSAQWEISTGKIRWTVGIVRRNQMPTSGLELNAFVNSKRFRTFQKMFPKDFTNLNRFSE